MLAEIPLGVVGREVVLGEGRGAVASAVEAILLVLALLTGNDVRHDAISAVGELLDAPELLIEVG